MRFQDDRWPARRPRSDSDSPPPSAPDVRRFLSESDEREVLNVLREQFRHELRITSDDVRVVVRAVASHGGAVHLPPDFPPTRWILEFKAVNGFAPLGGFSFGLPDRRSTSSVSSGGSSDGESERHTNHRYPSAARFRTHPTYDSDPQKSRRQQQHQQQQQRRSMVVDDRRVGAPWQRHEPSADREELGSSTSSFDGENGNTTGASSSSSVSTSSGVAPPDNTDRGSNSFDSSQDSSSGKRGYKLSHTVPAETWEKAIAAVEQQGMSLRAAAKIYGVHFAALHRRVKKRAQGGQSTKGNNGYFHPSDEAGITRVVVARAELGVLMTFDELMKLVEMAALRKLPDISVENARNLMVRFQSRNEQSIRHIIVDWPPPLPRNLSSSGVSLYHLVHPGYDYGSQPSSPTSMQRSLPARVVSSDGSATAAAVAAAPSQFAPPTRVGSYSPRNDNDKRPVLPSMTSLKSPPGSSTSSPPRLRGPRGQDTDGSRPVMFV